MSQVLRVDPFPRIDLSTMQVATITSIVESIDSDVHDDPATFFERTSMLANADPQLQERLIHGLAAHGGVIVTGVPIDGDVLTPHHRWRVHRDRYINESICALFAQFDGQEVFALAQEKDGQHAVNVSAVSEHACTQSHMGHSVPLHLHVENTCFRPIGLAPDRIVLLCIRPAPHGGDTLILRTPDLVAHLSVDEIDTLQEHWLQTHVPPSISTDGWSAPMPVLAGAGAGYQLTLDQTGQRVWPELPPAERREREALLTKVSQLAARLVMPVQLRSGDIMLWSNDYAHGRTPYPVLNDPMRDRYLLRMLTRDAEKLPQTRRCRPQCYTVGDGDLTTSSDIEQRIRRHVL